MKFRNGPALGALAACLGAAAILSACEGSSTEETITPLTGVRIDPVRLLGAQSCGTADDQIAKLVVLLEVVAADDAVADDNAAEPPVAPPPDGVPGGAISRSGVFDCFAEPTFLADAPRYATFRLRVFGYSASAYAANYDRITKASAATADATLAASSDATLAAGAGVVATCTATQQAEIRATAVCTIDRDSRPTAPVTDGGSSDAGLDDGGDASPSDAGNDDAGNDLDAGDASPSDAGDDDAGDGGS